MPKSQKCAHWQVNITARFSELRCEDNTNLNDLQEKKKDLISGKFSPLNIYIDNCLYFNSICGGIIQSESLLDIGINSIFGSLKIEKNKQIIITKSIEPIDSPLQLQILMLHGSMLMM